MRLSIFGNPFIIGRDGTREEVVKKHMEYARELIKTEPLFAELIRDYLYGHDLICCCSPLCCHGDNLIILSKELNMS